MELDTHLAIGLCHIALEGYSAEAAGRAFERAYELARQIGDPRKEIQALFGQWGHFWMRAEHDQAISLGRSLLAKTELLQDPITIMVGHRCLGSTLFTLGEFVQARSHLERALTLGEQSPGDLLAASYAVDPTIAAQLLLAWNLWMLGYPSQARENAERALHLATEKVRPYTLAFAHYVTSAVYLLCGNFEHSLGHATRSFDISCEHQINLYALYSRFGRGCALASLGQHEQAIADIQAAIEAADQSKLGYMRGFMLGGLARAQSDSAITTPHCLRWTRL